MKRWIFSFICAAALALAMLPAAAFASSGEGSLVAVADFSDGSSVEYRTSDWKPTAEEVLRLAVYECTANTATLTLKQDVTLSSGPLTVGGYKTVLTLKMDEGVSLKSTGAAIHLDSSGTLTIAGGSIEGSGSAAIQVVVGYAFSSKRCTLNVEGGSIACTGSGGCAVSAEGEVTVNITGGSLSAPCALKLNSAQASVSNAALDSTGVAVNISGSSRVSLQNCTVTAAGGDEDTKVSGIELGGSSNLSVQGGSITVSGTEGAVVTGISITGGSAALSGLAKVTASGTGAATVTGINITGGSAALSGGAWVRASDSGETVVTGINVQSGSVDISDWSSVEAVGSGSECSLLVSYDDGARAVLSDSSFLGTIVSQNSLLSELLADRYVFIDEDGVVQNSGDDAVGGSGKVINVTIDPELEVDYLDWNSDSGSLSTDQCVYYTRLENDDAAWKDGWYVVFGSVTVTGRVYVSGDVHLILTDGCELTLEQGIELGGNSLTIYSQSVGRDQTGRLDVRGPYSSLVGTIVLVDTDGVDSIDSTQWGSLTINGGDISVNSDPGNYAIHSYAINVKQFTMNAGTLSVQSGGCSATASPSDAYSNGIRAHEFAMNGGTLTVAGGNSIVSEGYSVGIFVRSSFSMSGGTLNASGGRSKFSYGLRICETANVSFNMGGGTLNATGGNGGNVSCGIFLDNISASGASDFNVSGGNLVLNCQPGKSLSYGLYFSGNVTIGWTGGNMYSTGDGGALAEPACNRVISRYVYKCYPVIAELMEIYGANAHIHDAAVTDSHGNNYGVKDLVTSADGKLCLFLPVGNATFNFNGDEHSCYVTENGGTLAGSPPVEGSVSISGSMSAGATLTAELSGVSGSAIYEWSWCGENGENPKPIEGAANYSCTLPSDPENYLGKYIMVKVKVSGRSGSLTAVTQVPMRSNACLITSFTIDGVKGVINNVAGTISLTVPLSSNITQLTPVIGLSEGATVSPASGTLVDFLGGVTFTVTAQDEVATKTYDVTVTQKSDIETLYINDKKIIYGSSYNVGELFNGVTFNQDTDTLTFEGAEIDFSEFVLDGSVNVVIMNTKTTTISGLPVSVGTLSLDSGSLLLSGDGNSLTISGSAVSGGRELRFEGVLTNSGWNGIGLDGSEGRVWGSYTLSGSFDIPAGCTFSIPEGAVLTNNGTLTNSGVFIIYSKGSLAGNGSVAGTGEFKLLNADSTSLRVCLPEDAVYNGSDYSAQVRLGLKEGFELQGASFVCEPEGWALTITKDGQPVVAAVDAGEYRFSYTKQGVSVVAALTVAKAAQAAPEVSGRYISSSSQPGKFTYIVDEIKGAEYRLDGGSWQDSRVFDGLEPGSTHTFGARLKADSNHELGAEGSVTAVCPEESYLPDTTPPEAMSYPVAVEAAEHGSVTAASGWGKPGEEVTLSVTPDEGWRLGSLSVVDADGVRLELRSLGEGKYAFTMPEGRVTVSAVFVADEGPDFTDIAPEAWYSEAVDYVSGRGLMNGVGDGAFDPEGSLTRAMVWTILARIEGEDTSGGANWYEQAQAWAVEAGISDGMDAAGSITREQIVTMLWRFCGEPDVDFLLTAGDAGSVSSWAYEAMRWAVSVGVIEGDDAGLITPSATATRAQAAAIIMRFCELTGK